MPLSILILPTAWKSGEHQKQMQPTSTPSLFYKKNLFELFLSLLTTLTHYRSSKNSASCTKWTSSNIAYLYLHTITSTKTQSFNFTKLSTQKTHTTTIQEQITTSTYLTIEQKPMGNKKSPTK
eukprot:Lithocolla_globosa_v1_NODE_4598_length_1405_cov_9.676558.p3 type:complete len:123 gc:universal NODE_4598_length_1405_cov_9.676558:483-115(-)